MITKLFTEFQKVKFYDEDHKYELNKNPMKSVTTVIGEYTEEFDTKYWSTYKAMEALGIRVRPYDKAGGLIWGDGRIRSVDDWRTREDIEMESFALEYLWAKNSEEGKARGTKRHKYMEDGIWGKHSGGQIPMLDKIIDQILSLYNPIRTEAIVYDEHYMLAGQVDLIAEYRKSGKPHGIDYKTNEELDLDNPYERFKPPISYMEASDIGKFQLQLNMYRFMLERKGVNLDKMFVLRLQDPAEWINIPRISVKHLLDDYNTKRTIDAKGNS